MENLSSYNQSFIITNPQKKLPEKLIYVKRNLSYIDLHTGKPFNLDSFVMADTKTGKKVGQMLGHPVKDCILDEIYPNKHKINTYEIANLRVSLKHHGYGTDFINIAKKESENSGCEGRIFLLASKMFNPDNPCHIFYRKKGFTTVFPRINKALDKSIAEGLPPSDRATENVFMYLPIEEKQPQQQILSRLSKWIKNLCKHTI